MKDEQVMSIYESWLNGNKEDTRKRVRHFDAFEMTDLLWKLKQFVGDEAVTDFMHSIKNMKREKEGQTEKFYNFTYNSLCDWDHGELAEYIIDGMSEVEVEEWKANLESYEEEYGEYCG